MTPVYLSFTRDSRTRKLESLSYPERIFHPHKKLASKVEENVPYISTRYFRVRDSEVWIANKLILAKERPLAVAAVVKMGLILISRSDLPIREFFLKDITINNIFNWTWRIYGSCC